jgi:putative aldouronate transport system substrate-binding protein
MKRKVIAFVVSLAMVSTLFAGCSHGSKNAEKGKEVSSGKDSGKVKEFTAFFAVEGQEINDDNEIQKKLADLTGAKCKETWLTGQTAEEAVGMLIAGGEYPDFIDGSTGRKQLIDAGAFIPLDKYWDDYPNVKNFWSESEWNRVRSKDGHIYTIPEFGKIYKKDTATIHNDEAFWIQTRVLKWAEYPKIKTLDQLFDLLEKYTKENPTMEDGAKVIPYEILTDDWYYYCLENPPQFLDGYPNNGTVIVDPKTYQVKDFNTSDTAVKYFRKLNEAYKKGMIDKEAFTMSRDQYIEKVSSGRVLCMVDQWWNFRNAEDAIKAQQAKTGKLSGCTYVPLGITIKEGIKEQYRNAPVMDVSNGMGISVDCKDVKGALQFINDLLSKEAMILRFWGEEGVDYNVGKDGVFTRTKKMRENAVKPEYKASHLCPYSYFPQVQGMCLDGINAYSSQFQPTEFYENLSKEVQECLDAYHAKTYVEMLNPAQEPDPWFPMWSHSNTMKTDTPGGLAFEQMKDAKHEYLPKVVLADNFDKAWDTYLAAYKKCKPEEFLNEMQEEVYHRIKVATGKDVKPKN